MSKPDRPASQYDSSHISKDVRADLTKLGPEKAQRVRDVADADKSPTPKAE
jgi:hypothetical protein